MQFICTYTLRPEHREAAIERFLKTGAPAPEGVKLLGRWHDASLHRGFVLVEASEVEPAARMCHEWADLLTLEMLPVLDDAQLGKVLSSPR